MNVIMLSVASSYCYAECWYSLYHYAECRYAEYHGTKQVTLWVILTGLSYFFSATTLSIATFSIVTFSIMTQHNDTKHTNIQHNNKKMLPFLSPSSNLANKYQRVPLEEHSTQDNKIEESYLGNFNWPESELPDLRCCFN